MRRREFLKFGLGFAGGMGGGGLMPFAAIAGSAGLAERLAAFGKDLRGRLITADDAAYAMASQPFNAAFEDTLPLAVVVAADEADVATSIAFAREESLPFAVRNGGHSFAGYSASKGLVIDVSRLNTVRANPAKATVTVGAGQTNLALYEALWPHRMVVPAGTCPTVGITGLALGGGFGRLSPLHGLTSDNLLGLRMVTAEGKVIVADPKENSDLYWACRGGGGGNFGVVTELTFRLQPVDMDFTEIQHTFAWESALGVLRAWQDWITTLPREGHCELELITGAPGPTGSGATVTVDFTLAGPREQAEALARDLVGAAKATPVSTTTTTASFLSTERDWSCAGLRPDECRTAGITPDRKLARTSIYIGSDFVFSPWPEEGCALLIDAITRRQGDRTLTPETLDPDAQVGKVLLESCGGAINDTAPDATAFPHRGMIYMAQYQSRWLPGAAPEIAEANIAWTREMYDSVAEYRSGASYVNYIDPYLAGWQDAYYGANLPRLREIKGKYDPENVFQFEQSIRLP